VTAAAMLSPATRPNIAYGSARVSVNLPSSSHFVAPRSIAISATGSSNGRCMTFMIAAGSITYILTGHLGTGLPSWLTIRPVNPARCRS
jgi:hypothetical protein